MGMTASLFIINNTSAFYGNFYTSFLRGCLALIMQISPFTWPSSFARFDHLQASQCRIYIYSNLEAAQRSNELLCRAQRPAVTGEGVKGRKCLRAQTVWETN